MDVIAFNRTVTVRQTHAYKAAGSDNSKFDGQRKLDSARSGQGRAVGEGLFLGEAMQCLDPALLIEIMEQLPELELQAASDDALRAKRQMEDNGEL